MAQAILWCGSDSHHQEPSPYATFRQWKFRHIEDFATVQYWLSIVEQIPEEPEAVKGAPGEIYMLMILHQWGICSC